MVEICEQTRPWAGYIPGNPPHWDGGLSLNVLDAAGNVRIAPAAANWKFGLASVVFLLKPGLSSGGANNRGCNLRFNRRHVSLTQIVTNGGKRMANRKVSIPYDVWYCLRSWICDYRNISVDKFRNISVDKFVTDLLLEEIRNQLRYNEYKNEQFKVVLKNHGIKQIGEK